MWSILAIGRLSRRSTERLRLRFADAQLTAGLILIDHGGRTLINNEAAQKLLRDERLDRNDGRLNLSRLPIARLVETVKSQGAFCRDGGRAGPSDERSWRAFVCWTSDQADGR